MATFGEYIRQMRLLYPSVRPMIFSDQVLSLPYDRAKSWGCVHIIAVLRDFLTLCTEAAPEDVEAALRMATVQIERIVEWNK